MWHLSKIPKIAHFYWGNDTLSYLRFMTIYSFRKFNPDWEVRFYYPKVKYRGAKTWPTFEHSGKFTGLNYLDTLWSLPLSKIEVNFSDFGLNDQLPESFKADFLRWRLLGTVGGLWSDFDIIYFRPLEQLYLNALPRQSVDTVVCLGEDVNHNYHSIGFLLGSRHNRYYQFISEAARGCLNPGVYQSVGSQIPNAYFPNLAAIRARFPELNVANLAMNVVYPLDYTMTPYLFHTGYLHYLAATSVGVHWFAGHPEAGVFENLLNEHTIINYDNIIALLIKQNGMLTCIKG